MRGDFVPLVKTAGVIQVDDMTFQADDVPFFIVFYEGVYRDFPEVCAFYLTSGEDVRYPSCCYVFLTNHDFHGLS